MLHERRQPLQLLQQERRPLVGGEAPGEADRQHLEVQRAARRVDSLVRFAVARELPNGPPPDEIEQASLQHLVRLPQLAVVDGVDAGPDLGLSAALGPARAHVPVVQPAHLRSEPRVHVDTVGHVPDRNLVRGPFRPEAVPHAPADAAVQRRDAVGVAAQLEGQDGHAELLRRILRLDPPKSEKVILGESAGVAQRPQVLLHESGGNRSWPAATGVCVVKQVISATPRAASSNERALAAICRRTSSRVAKAL